MTIPCRGWYREKIQLRGSLLRGFHPILAFISSRRGTLCVPLELVAATVALRQVVHTGDAVSE